MSDRIIDDRTFDIEYWFLNNEIITVVNPRSEDYIFKTVVQTGINMGTGKPAEEQRTYRVKAGESERFPGTIANLYLNQMSKLVAQDDERQDIADPSVRAMYYDQLIVAKENLIDNFLSFDTPAGETETTTAQPKKEVPFGILKETKADK